MVVVVVVVAAAAGGREARVSRPGHRRRGIRRARAANLVPRQVRRRHGGRGGRRPVGAGRLQAVVQRKSAAVAGQAIGDAAARVGAAPKARLLIRWGPYARAMSESDSRAIMAFVTAEARERDEDFSGVGDDLVRFDVIPRILRHQRLQFIVTHSSNTIEFLQIVLFYRHALCHEASFPRRPLQSPMYHICILLL